MVPPPGESRPAASTQGIRKLHQRISDGDLLIAQRPDEQLKACAMIKHEQASTETMLQTLKQRGSTVGCQK